MAKKKIQISPRSSQKVGNAKENSILYPKMTEMPLVDKEHKDLQKHPQWIESNKNIPQWIRNHQENSSVSQDHQLNPQ